MYEEERLTVLEMDLPDSTPVVLGVQKPAFILGSSGQWSAQATGTVACSGKFEVTHSMPSVPEFFSRLLPDKKEKGVLVTATSRDITVIVCCCASRKERHEAVG